MTSPFDFVNDLSFGKKDLIRSSDDPESMTKQYNPWIINKAFSYYADTILYANEINMYGGCDNLLQHDFYLNSLSKKKRFSKWSKTVKLDDIELLSKFYNVNATVAKEYLSLLTEEQLKSIRIRASKGGLQNGKHI